MRKSMVTKKIYVTVMVSALLLNQKVYVANAITEEHGETEKPILSEVNGDGTYVEKVEGVQQDENVNDKTDTTVNEGHNELKDQEYNSSEIVQIKDQKLLQIINVCLGKGEEVNTPVTMDELSKIKTLAIINQGVESLEGLQYAVNLDELIIENEAKIANKENIDIISSISSITKLRLVNCGIDNSMDLNHLANMKNLTHLSLLDNKITNIDFLADCKTILVLLLGGNNIEDISPLKELSNLIQLDLYNNNISDLTPLSKLTSLTLLDLSKNKISDINTLANLKKLDWLFLNNNSISDISPLKDINISGLSVLNQEINLNKQTITENIFTLKSPIKGKDGKTVLIKDVLSLGINKEDSITWTDIVPGNNKFIMSFEEFKAAGEEAYFSGIVYQYVDYIKENSAPIITASDKTITVGDKFDPLKDVKAHDEEDGDLTDKIKVTENTVDTSKEGIYKVIYEVVDKEGKTFTKEVKVTVNKKATGTTKPVTKPTTTKKPVSKLPNTGGGTGTGLVGVIITSLGFVFARKNKK
ncbi:leucine-rich repeat domain-containing protein [Clostridium sp.]|uniref:leucine-rich repeat domain-containing protein n=1 Tax=Clostridium sp. TaxID=1506 RepID=UPI003F2AA031